MPWQKNYDETVVLERATRAFWTRGYEATSMGDLVKATGINRGSMYTAFPSKHALFMRALEYYDRVYRADHLARMAAENCPREAIVAVFETAAHKPADADAPWGCLLVNTALELSPHDPEVAQFVNRSLTAVEDFFCERIEAGQNDGSIGTAFDARERARSLLGLFLGLRVLTRANTAQATLDAVTAQATEMLA